MTRAQGMKLLALAKRAEGLCDTMADLGYGERVRVLWVDLSLAIKEVEETERNQEAAELAD